MADLPGVQVQDMPAASQVNNADLLMIVQSDVNKKATKSQLLDGFALVTETGNKINLEMNNTTYVLTAKLYDKNNNLISTSTGIDLPIESMVVNATYDSTNKQIILTLQNGTTINVPVGDLVSGLQEEITSENKLASDLVDDSDSTNKFVTASDKTTWNAKQNALTFDSTPTESSTNPCTSGGIKTYVDTIVGDIESILEELDIGGGVE